MFKENLQQKKKILLNYDQYFCHKNIEYIIIN